MNRRGAGLEEMAQALAEELANALERRSASSELLRIIERCPLLIADEAMIAVQNVRLFEEVQRRSRELSEALEQQTATSAILRAIAGSPTDVQPVLEAVAESAARLCQAYDAVLFLREGDSLVWKSHCGPIPPRMMEKVPINRDWVAGRAFLDRRPCHVHSVQDWEDFSAGKEFARQLGHRTALVVPLVRENEAIGVLAVRRIEERPFSEKQIDLLCTFADQALIAIQNTHLFNEVQQRNRELAATSEVLGVISRSPTDVQPVFETIARSAATLCNSEYAYVHRVDGKLDHLAAQYGAMPEAAEATRRMFPMEPTRGTAGGRAILSRSVEQIPDYHNDPEYDLDFKKAATLAGVRGAVAVPMLREEEPIGAIVLDRTEAGYYPERQVELLKTFADQAVIAIENVRLFKELEVRTQELGEALQQQTATADVLKVISRSAFDLDAVFQTLLDSAARLCAADRGVISRRDGDVLRIVAGYQVTPEHFAYEQLHPHAIGRGTFHGRAALEGTTIHVPDVLLDPEYERPEAAITGRFRAVVAVPIRREGDVVGVFGLGKEAPGPFSQRHVELVETFADQAGIAIENVRLFDEVQARTRELQQALEYQTATSEVLNVISRSPTELQPVLDVIIETAVKLCEADLGTIARERDGGFVRTGQYGSMSGEFRKLMADAPVEMTRGSITGRTLVEGKVVHILDAKTDLEYTWGEALSLEEIRTGLGVPLLRKGTPIGAIALVRREVRPFTNKQIELVTTFADQAVIAIENARLFEEVQARTRELEARSQELSESLQRQTATADVLKVISRSTFDLKSVLQTLIESAAKLCDADMANITRQIDGTFVRTEFYGASPEFIETMNAIQGLPVVPDRGSAHGRALLESKVVHIADVEADSEYTFEVARRLGGFRTTLGVPMMREGVPIGSMALSRAEVRPFTDKQIELVSTFADQAAIAIENVRLFDQVQARTRELQQALEYQTATSDVLSVISRSPSKAQPVLDTIVTTAGHLCQSEYAFIFMRKEDGQYHLQAWHLAEPDLLRFLRANPITPGRSTVTGRAVMERRTIHIPDVAADPDYVWDEWMDLSGVRTLLGVPLLRDGDPIGVIAASRNQKGPFTDRQIELVTTFADQAVIAIENARLFDEVQARTAELTESLQQQTATADVLKVISRSAFDLNSVLQTLVESAAHLCDADTATITRQIDGVFIRAETYGAAPEFVEQIRGIPVVPDRRSAQGRALLEGKVIHITDIEADPEYTFEGAKRLGARTILGVPMMREGIAIGSMALARSEVRPFTDKQIELVSTFADQAAIAIENVRLFESVEARTRELTRSLEDLRAAQDRLIQTEKLASLGQLTAGIAHEIKNPLNFVNNFSALSVELIEELRELVDEPQTQQRRAELGELMATLKANLEKVSQHGKRADSIVKNMLLHSRQGSSEHRLADINAIVEESLNLAYHGARAERQGFNITLEKYLDPEAGEVDIYPQEITRVLLNMISNGFYATIKRSADANGRGYEPTLSATTRNLGDHVEIRIRDNGTGIPSEVREKVFLPFFTTKPAGEGTGLGLSLSYDIIVKQHAGTIELDTKPGEFTEFRIVLPRSVASLGESGTNP